jgi:hypothetical protein
MIVSTPQNLAYVFFILIVLFGLNCRQTLDKINIILLALATFFIHPIAGIPALIFALILSLRNSNIKRKKFFYTAGFIFLALALPLAFRFAENLNSPQEPQQLEGTNPNIISQLTLNWPADENIILNSLYLFIFNLHFLFTLLALSGIFIWFKHRKKCGVLISYFLAFLSLLGAYLLIVKLPFAFLIDYERNDYSGRVLLLAGFTLIPFVVLAFYTLLARLKKQNAFIQSPFYIFFALILSASLYASYPRFDNFHNSRGYSLSSSDIMAVEWIEQDAKNDYIVLSNQQVSAAALKTYGFKKYFLAKDSGKEIFYYPIPTGEKLYSYYLDMVYKKPNRATINQALDYTGAETAYFVLNKYWWAAPKILAEAELEADSKHEINQGEITIFKYQKTKKAP